ncbi:MAG: 2-succinyl-6-hydroxy-2,4-cyclohexadiene-1-carboxylate synthase [Chloroflexota bacterium]|nr:2-succinyl-6-hydroxy-2,4-cyclohexadiene-1-carboxylate synthase [Chloroflexota bacterium]
MKINGVDYHVTVTGYGEPLALLHGFTGSGTSWSAHLPWLSGHFQVVTVDLLGHGATGKPDDPARYAMPRAADDLHAILRACGAESSHLLGYSMGGRLALYYALSHPLRSLILESASPGLADAAARAARQLADDALAERIACDGIEAFVDEWERLPLFASHASLPDAPRAALRAARLHNDPIGLAGSLRGMGTGAQPNLWDRLSAVDAPTLLLCGALDVKFTDAARAMQKRLRNARVEVIQDAGHTPHLERPTAWRDVLLRFVRDLSRRRMA